MKKALLVVTGILVLLLITNPGIATHKEAMAQKLQEEYVLSDKAKALLRTSEPTSQLTRQLIVQEHLQNTTRNNFALFSLTELHYMWNGSEINRKTVGIGLLGQVYVWGGN
jgi:hypothetical protein